VEASLTELSSGPTNQHVMTSSQMEVCPPEMSATRTDNNNV